MPVLWLEAWHTMIALAVFLGSWSIPFYVWFCGCACCVSYPHQHHLFGMCSRVGIPPATANPLWSLHVASTVIPVSAFTIDNFLVGPTGMPTGPFLKLACVHAFYVILFRSHTVIIGWSLRTHGTLMNSNWPFLFWRHSFWGNFSHSIPSKRSQKSVKCPFKRFL